jgi:addiction module HigA family antidote
MNKNNDRSKNAFVSLADGEDGIAGNPDGVDMDSASYKQLREAIKARSAVQTAGEKLEIEFNAIRYRMMEYIRDDSNNNVVEPGEFIRQYLKAAKVKQNTFASFMHTNPGNLGKLLKGKRKINYETAMILGNTFKVEPKIWLYIQDKNEMVRLNQDKQNAYRQYTIDNLIGTEAD